VTPQDVAVSWLPLYHDMGLIGMWLTPIYCGCPVVLMSPLAFLSRPARWLQVLSRHRGTITAAPNFAFDLVARRVADAELEGLDLSPCRLALNGAEPVSAATLEAFAARLAPAGFRRGALFPAYGLAECCVGLAFPPLGRGPAVDTISRRVLAEERRAAPVPANDPQALPVVACGRAIPGHALRVVDALGQELPDGQVGRLQFRGPSATPGYYRNPEATRRLLAGEWRETGDYAYIADGEVRLTGREKDLIIRGGRNLYPYELEQAVGALEGVRRGCVAVFASADARGGTERLVVLAETREEDEAARERLRLRINELAADVVGLPADEVVLAPPHTVLKTSSGKIRRSACRELYEQGLVGASQARHSLWWAMARLGLRAGVQRLRFFARGAAARAYGIYAWALFLAIAVPLWCTVAAVGRPAFGRRAGHLAARLILRLAGLPWRAGHLDRVPARTHVLAVNHASYLDAIYLTAALPAEPGYCFIAKREFAGHWLPRLFFRGIGALFVERFDVRRGVEDVDTLAEALAAGRNLVIFPEGTFSRETGLRAFRTGAFAAAARAGVPVVAAGLRGVRAVLRDGTWLPRRGPVDFEIGPVLPPGGEDWAGVVRLRDAARAEVLRLCGEPDIAGAGLPFAPPGPGGPA
jgi:1-acyl-sn-glycerol-3-phosphate acyltransferase